jgi:hypothetical protein
MATAELVCERCDSPLERDDLRCAICSRAAPVVAPEDLPEAQVEVLRCGGCGAAMTYTIRAQAPECAFCGSVLHVERPEDPLEQTRHFLPFTVDRATAEKTFRTWLRSLGWFRPSDLVSASRIESLRALWWVGWVFDASALVSWTADSNHDSQRASWAPHAGQTEIEFDDVVVLASRGLDEAEFTHLVSSYDLGSARGQPEGAGDEAVIERFDVQRSLARQKIAAVIDRLAGERLQQGAIPGSRFRNVHVSTLLRRLVTGRYAFPAYVMAYRYRNRLYRFVLSGQDSTCLLGKAPYSALKIAATVIGGAALIMLLSMIGACRLLFG